MVFERQNSGGVFVAWGEEKAKDNSFVVKAGEYIEGVITDIKPSDKYGIVFELKAKTSQEPLLVVSTRMLLKETGYERDDDNKMLPDEEQSIIKAGGKRVVVGDVVRIHFDGMVKTKHKDAYKLWVEVDRPDKV